MIAPRAQSTQTTDRLAQARSARELREDHAEQLIHAREAAELPVPPVSLDGRLERAAWQQFQQLGKDGATRVHGRIVA